MLKPYVEPSNKHVKQMDNASTIRKLTQSTEIPEKKMTSHLKNNKIRYHGKRTTNTYIMNSVISDLQIMRN